MNLERLKRNRLPDDYVYNPSEGRQMPPGLLLGPVEKQRSEQIVFLEAVAWLLNHKLVGFRASGDVFEDARKEAERRYPQWGDR